MLQYLPSHTALHASDGLISGTRYASSVGTGHIVATDFNPWERFDGFDGFEGQLKHEGTKGLQDDRMIEAINRKL